MISIEAIAAMSENRIIGREGHLPWGKIAADLQFFRQMTMNRVLIMGRKSCESLPGPLGGRYLIGVSKSVKRIACVQEVVSSFEEAIVAAIREYAKRSYSSDKNPILIAGGESAYKWALDKGVLSVIHLTTIHERKDGDAVMPDFDKDFVEHYDGDFEQATLQKLAQSEPRKNGLISIQRFARRGSIQPRQLAKPPAPVANADDVSVPGAAQPF